jgi:hypothetical protein
LKRPARHMLPGAPYCSGCRTEAGTMAKYAKAGRRLASWFGVCRLLRRQCRHERYFC